MNVIGMLYALYSTNYIQYKSIKLSLANNNNLIRINTVIARPKTLYIS